MESTHITYLQLGSNQGDRHGNLDKAMSLLKERVGRLISRSQIYETDAWGVQEQPDFFNQVLLFQTALSPRELLTVVLDIEKSMGRIRQQKWGPRLIDIDILLYDELIIKEPGLRIPHPQLQHRKFVLIPLVEIAPTVKHPVLQKSIQELVESCEDQQEVRIL